MKKILLFLLLLTFFAIATCYSFSVFADFDQTYQDYLYLQDGYRLSLTNFQTAKNRYLTYKTLTSQTEALAATKTFLETRDQVSITYLSLLLDKNPGDLSSKLINEEVGFFSSHRVKISAVGSLEDAVKSSDSVKEHFPRTETIARQAVTTILIKKINELKERQIVLESEFEEKVNILRNLSWLMDNMVTTNEGGKRVGEVIDYLPFPEREH